jgi:hypothetical protein
MRIREVTVLSGGAEDDNLLALSQALAGAAASSTGIAAAQNPQLAADPDAYALLQAPADTVPLVLEAAAAGPFTSARKISFTSTANLSGINFTVQGIDENGQPDVHVYAGPNNNTVTANELWRSITAITPDGTDVGTVSVGFPISMNVLTLTGGAAALDPVRQVTLVSGAAADYSGVQFNVTGLDANGVAQTIFVPTGPNNGTVIVGGTWSSVTRIEPNNIDVSPNANISAGWTTTDGDMTTDGIALEAGADELVSPNHITLTSTSDLSGITFTVYGKDRRGMAFTEELAGPNNDTVTSLGVYGSVQKIVPDATSNNSVSAGVVAGGVSPWYLHDTTASRDDLPNGSLQVMADPTPVAGQVEYTHENAARIKGEACEADADPSAIAGTAGEVVVLEKRPWFRIRNTEDAGSLRVKIARPRF